jgi:hypothetical protein
MRFRILLTAAALAAPIALACPALAAEPAKKHFGDPMSLASDVTLDPILDARLRW